MHFSAEGTSLTFYHDDFTKDASGKLVLTEKAKHQLCQQQVDVKKICFKTQDNDVFAYFAALNEALSNPAPSQESDTASAANVISFPQEVVDKFKAVESFSFEVGFSDQFNLEKMQSGLDKLLEASAEKQFDINLSFCDTHYSAARTDWGHRAPSDKLAVSKELLKAYVSFCEGLPGKLAANPGLHIRRISNLIGDIDLSKLLSHCPDIEAISDLTLRSVSPTLLKTLTESCPNLNEFHVSGNATTETVRRTLPTSVEGPEEIQRKVKQGVNLAPFISLESSHPNLKLCCTITVSTGSSDRLSTDTIPIAEIAAYMKINNPTLQVAPIPAEQPSTVAAQHSVENVVEAGRVQGEKSCCSVQ